MRNALNELFVGTLFGAKVYLPPDSRLSGFLREMLRLRLIEHWQMCETCTWKVRCRNPLHEKKGVSCDTP